MSEYSDSINKWSTDGATRAESRLAAALAEFQESLAEGSADGRKALLHKYGDIADLLEPCLDGLSFLCKAVPNQATPELNGNTPLQLGDYHIIRELGRGGMGVVYEAEQRSLGRRVALKIFPMAAILGERQLTRFQNEARAAALLEHPNIVPVYSVGCDNGVHYYVMQLIEGQNLAEAIGYLRTFEKDDEQANGAVSNFLRDFAEQGVSDSSSRNSTRQYYRSVAKIGIQAAEALHYAHQEGIIHRDIKPANLLIDNSGSVYVSDFGLARVVAEPPMTMTGDVLGTIRYMSPEQTFGKHHVLDHRTDVYSVGITLYELLTHQLPFDGNDREKLLKQIAFEQPKPPCQWSRSIPNELETIVLKAIERKPEDRYATAQGLADDLQSFLEGRPIAARPVGPIEKTWRAAKRNPVISLLCCLFVGSLIAGTLISSRLAILANENARAMNVARLESEESANIANTQRELAERSLYANQLARIGSIWRQAPSRARQQLEECPEQHREFTWRYLSSQLRREQGVLKGHESSILHACFSNDGRLVATGGEEGAVRIWDAVHARLKREIRFPGRQVAYVNVSEDGTLLVSSRVDNDIALWDVATGTRQGKIKGHIGGVSWAEFSADGQYLYSASTDGTLRQWDRNTRAELKRLGHVDKPLTKFGDSPHCIISAVLSPDESIVATGDWGGTLTLWNIETGEHRKQDKAHSQAIRSITYSPDGNYVITTGYDWKIKKWSIDTLDTHWATPHLYCQPFTVSYSPDGGTFVVANLDSTVMIRDAKNGKLVETYAGHTQGVSHAEYSSDGKRLLSCGQDGLAFLWLPGANHGNALASCQERLWCVDVSCDNVVAAAGEQGRIVVTDLIGGTKVTEKLEDIGTIKALAFSPDGKRLALAGETAIAIVDPHDNALPVISSENTPSQLLAIDYSDDGSRLLVSGEDGFMQIRNSILLEQKENLKWHTSRVKAVAFSPAGDRIVSGGVSDGSRDIDELCLWNAKSRKKIKQLSGHNHAISALAYSPDGLTIASASDDQRVLLRHADTGETYGQLIGHKGHVLSVAYSPDGRTIATSGQDKTIRLWDARTGIQWLVLDGHKYQVCSICFSPDGNQLISSGWDGSIRRWSAIEGIKNSRP